MMSVLKIIVSGFIIGALFIVFDMIIGIGTAPFFSAYSNLAIWKNPPNIVAGMVFDLVNGFILVVVYLILSEGIPSDGWKKGITYGALVGLFRVVMSAFSTIVMYDIPLILVIINLITGYLEVIVLGVVTSQICEKYVNKTGSETK